MIIPCRERSPPNSLLFVRFLQVFSKILGIDQPDKMYSSLISGGSPAQLVPFYL